MTALHNTTPKTLGNNYSEDADLCSFEMFGGFGNEQDRQKYIAALTHKLSNDDSKKQIDFPQSEGIKALSEATASIVNQADLLTLTRENPEIAKEIAQNVSKWAKNLYRSIQKDDSFEDLETEISKIKVYSQDEFSAFLSPLETKKVDEENADEDVFNFAFYCKKNNELINLLRGDNIENKKREKIIAQQVALKLSFENNLENILTKARLRKELKLIDEARQAFTDELYKRIADFVKLKALLQPFTNDLGRLWDMSSGMWQRTGFDVLRKYADMLEKDASLNELAELLGRLRKAENEYEEEQMEETIIKQEWQIKHAQKSEIIGIRESDDLNAMLPSESALLADLDTEMLFYKKFAEKKLVTFDYQAKESRVKEEKKQVTKQKEKDKGPVIICVDTSGSMHGTPEQVAKILCFAILKVAMRDKRKCYLISFSTSIQTLDLTDLPNSLDKLIDFLNMSFQGGTDATPAIEAALKMLNTNDYQKSDVLLISDFVMPEFDSATEEALQLAKNNKTQFHSLTIGTTGNSNTLNSFNNNWVYNPNDKNSIKELVKNVKALK